MITRFDFQQSINSSLINPELLSRKKADNFFENADKTLKIVIEYVAKGAEILFIDGKILSVKWYSITSIIRIIKLGKLFINLIQEFHNIWKKDQDE